MIITKTEPFTKEEINSLQEQFETYIKTVFDLENKTCAAGMRMHFDGEQLLLEQGSHQEALWGGGIDVETKEVGYSSFINIRPSDGNTSNELLSQQLRDEFRNLTEFFFKELYEH